MKAQNLCKACGVLIFGLLVWTGSAQAQSVRSNICRYDSRGGATPGGMPDCPTESNFSGGNTVIDTNYDGVRANAGPWYGYTPVDVFNHCRYIDNLTASTDSFIPFKSPDEWERVRANYPDILGLTHCALPYHYVNAFGPTSVQFDKGDKGDKQYADEDLPYARKGTTRLSTHTFSNSCYDEHAVEHCWKTTTCYDELGVASTCCADMGSVCEINQWYPWSEVWTFTAYALDSEVNNPSWAGYSSRTGGTARPNQCLTRCTMDAANHDCSCAQQTAPIEACSIPDAVPVSASCVLIGGVANFGPTFEINYALVIINKQSKIQAAKDAGDCETAASLQTDLNSLVTDMNKACDAYWIANPQFHIPPGL